MKHTIRLILNIIMAGIVIGVGTWLLGRLIRLVNNRRIKKAS